MTQPYENAGNLAGISNNQPVDLTIFFCPRGEILSHGTIFLQSRKFLLKNETADGILAPSQEKGRRTMQSFTMHKQNTARFAQCSCARFVCSENNSIIIILDAVMASIFALISIRLLPAQAARNLTICHQAPHFA